MSNLLPLEKPLECHSVTSIQPELQAYPSKKVDLGRTGLIVNRALPRRQRRLIGPWCFLDHFGPTTFSSGKPLDVGPHPHIGLQTVTWLFTGEVLHKDSLGNEQLIRPGQLNLMTSGRGISHSEETPIENSGKLDGIQLWTALPDAYRNSPPSFEHYDDLRDTNFHGCVTKVMAGKLGDVASPARVFSPIVAAEFFGELDCKIEVPVQPEFEHALFLIYGYAEFYDLPLNVNTLYYVGTKRRTVELRLSKGAVLIVIGGQPFPEQILMWWNFVARTQEEIEQARFQWEHQNFFGNISNYDGSRMSAPPLDLRFKR